MSLSEKKGRFLVAREMIDKNPREVLDILKSLDVLVVAARWSFDGRTVEYLGLCDVFEPVGKYEFIPLYNIIVTKEEDGTLFVEAKK